MCWGWDLEGGGPGRDQESESVSMDTNFLQISHPAGVPTRPPLIVRGYYRQKMIIFTHPNHKRSRRRRTEVFGWLMDWKLGLGSLLVKLVYTLVGSLRHSHSHSTFSPCGWLLKYGRLMIWKEGEMLWKRRRVRGRGRNDAKNESESSVLDSASFPTLTDFRLLATVGERNLQPGGKLI